MSTIKKVLVIFAIVFGLVALAEPPLGAHVFNMPSHPVFSGITIAGDGGIRFPNGSTLSSGQSVLPILYSDGGTAISEFDSLGTLNVPISLRLPFIYEENSLSTKSATHSFFDSVGTLRWVLGFSNSSDTTYTFGNTGFIAASVGTDIRFVWRAGGAGAFNRGMAFKGTSGHLVLGNDDTQDQGSELQVFGGVEMIPQVLGTCTANRVGEINTDSASGTGGVRTRICACTYAGSAGTYAWVNIFSGTVGTQSACN